MNLSGISALGWAHSAACVVAILAGAYVLCAAKGTRRHRLWGWWYGGAMMLQNLLVLFIYDFDIGFGPHAKPGSNTFGFFHYGALATMAVTAVGLYGARLQRRGGVLAHLHPQAMLLSYYLLLSGLVNELFARVLVLRHYALLLSPKASSTVNTWLVRDAQSVLVLLWLLLAIRFALKTAGRRKPPAFTLGYPLRYTGGIVVACAGLGIVIAAATGSHSTTAGLVVGLVIGILASRRLMPTVQKHWGFPSVAQSKMATFALVLEISAFSIMGATGLFARLPPPMALDATLAIIAAYCVLMLWSHGRLMPLLGFSLVTWLGFSSFIHIPLQGVALGDGLIKLIFGTVMAYPALQRAARSEELPQEQLAPLNATFEKP